MPDINSKLDPAYLEEKRQQLLKLKAELRTTQQASAAEGAGIEDASGAQGREFEDDAQKLDLLEKEEALGIRATGRLALIDRALEKIADGTYGYSDVSGHRIPKERLDILPEAATTVGEAEAEEKRV